MRPRVTGVFGLATLLCGCALEHPRATTGREAGGDPAAEDAASRAEAGADRACPEGEALCGGRCVDVQGDGAHCGRCDARCAAPESCVGGVCGCAGGQMACRGLCVDPATDRSHCGGCDRPCGEGSCVAGRCGCSSGQTLCAGRCVDGASDPRNCGACGNVCAAGRCEGGSCGASAVVCESGRGNCNGDPADRCEVDLQVTAGHCGACERACAAGQRCVGGLCASAESCRDIARAAPGLPSGWYDIRPAGAAAELRVWCDLETDGGGWTVVYLWPGGNLASSTLAYDVDSLALRRSSREVLMAYRDAARRVTLDTWARFPLPTEWVERSPFGFERGESMVMASIGGAAARGATLRFGFRDFGDDCRSPWRMSGVGGRVCLVGTEGPFFNGFSSGLYRDRCASSDQRWDAVFCTDTRRFSLALR